MNHEKDEAKQNEIESNPGPNFLCSQYHRFFRKIRFLLSTYFSLIDFRLLLWPIYNAEISSLCRNWFRARKGFKTPSIFFVVTNKTINIEGIFRKDSAWFCCNEHENQLGESCGRVLEDISRLINLFLRHIDCVLAISNFADIEDIALRLAALHQPIHVVK